MALPTWLSPSLPCFFLPGSPCILVGSSSSSSLFHNLQTFTDWTACLCSCAQPGTPVACRHPRVVSLLDIFELDSCTFATVLELCEGNDLDLHLQRHQVCFVNHAPPPPPHPIPVLSPFSAPSQPLLSPFSAPSPPYRHCQLMMHNPLKPLPPPQRSGPPLCSRPLLCTLLFCTLLPFTSAPSFPPHVPPQPPCCPPPLLPLPNPNVPSVHPPPLLPGLPPLIPGFPGCSALAGDAGTAREGSQGNCQPDL